MQTDFRTVTEPQFAATTVPRRSIWETRVVVLSILVLGLALSAVVLLALRNKIPPPTVGTATTVKQAKVLYPVGVANPAEPSGMAPPAANALGGYHLVYASDFKGGTLPPGWDVFTGVPAGTNGQFAASHTVVANGMLQLNTYQDPAYDNRWTSGGLCQCGAPLEYGAFFVRARITGPGTNEVLLLWPTTNAWPPEVDFTESGVQQTATSWTVHYPPGNSFFQRTLGHINLTQWHTWGVIWTPTELVFTVDGKSWGSFRDAGAVPHQPLTLDLQQRPVCRQFTGCQAAAQSMLVDWVAEYQR